jgi:hypothetical protein
MAKHVTKLTPGSDDPKDRPKLRKWYGQDSSVGDPNAEKPEGYDMEEEKEEDSSKRDVPADTEESLKAWDAQPRRATLVSGADTALGEVGLLQKLDPHLESAWFPLFM